MSEDTRESLINVIVPTIPMPMMPIPESQPGWITQAFQDLVEVCKMVVDTIVRPAIGALKSIWRDIQRWYRNVRASDTHTGKQSAWKIMHPMRARKRSTKRAHIYRMKRLADIAHISEDMGVYD